MEGEREADASLSSNRIPKSQLGPVGENKKYQNQLPQTQTAPQPQQPST
jgi:hypothetical protein